MKLISFDFILFIINLIPTLPKEIWVNAIKAKANDVKSFILFQKNVITAIIEDLWNNNVHIEQAYVANAKLKIRMHAQDEYNRMHKILWHYILTSSKFQKILQDLQVSKIGKNFQTNLWLFGNQFFAFHLFQIQALL